jgi:undecaprenyl-diphosphatase
MVWVSALGSGWLAVAFVAAAGLSLLGFRLRREALFCVSGAGLGAALNRTLKVIIARPRPAGSLVNIAITYEHESFPSGHTVLFVVVFGFLILTTCLFAQRAQMRIGLVALFGCLMLLVGVSRIHLGAHWPSDVAGGYLLGFLTLGVMAGFYRRISSRSK